MMKKILMLCLIGPGVSAHAVELVDADGLAGLEGANEWPVVDARDLFDQSRNPIPGAIAYERGITLSGPVLVVASDPRNAREAAEELEGRLEGVEAHAVLGGTEDLRRIRSDLSPETVGNTNMPSSYTIPSDTCQPGPALHTFSDQD